MAVCRFVADFPGPWWVGGGWAADVWLGQLGREHEDIEICVLRRDQEAVFAKCAGYQFYTPVNNDFAPMAEGERLAAPRFMLQVRRPAEMSAAVPGLPSQFEFFMND